VTSLFLITHGNVGEAMLDMAVETLGRSPLPVRCLAVMPDDEPVGLLDRARRILDEFPPGDVIVLTDLFGSTPSNIATHLSRDHPGMVMIAGLNIPMLIRLLNYAGSDSATLVDKAISGGRDGIFVYDPGRADWPC
jgi:PTS system ascorbate-specific IIA component